MIWLTIEQTRLQQLRAGEIRVVHSQSARKHKRKGDRIQWCSYFGAYIWFPESAK